MSHKNSQITSPRSSLTKIRIVNGTNIGAANTVVYTREKIIE